MATMTVLEETFQKRAEAVSAVVTKVTGMAEAFDYALDLCERKEACQLLAAGCGEPLSADAEALCGLKQQKVIAAPALPTQAWTALKQRCDQSGILLTDRPLRRHLAGIDIGFTLADLGIAETGTLVIDSGSEEVRLATMISEIHVAVLPISRLRCDALAAEAELREFMQKPAGYLAFITGASRTADIERVLAIGVHGPLELHVLMMEEV